MSAQLCWFIDFYLKGRKKRTERIKGMEIKKERERRQRRKEKTERKRQQLKETERKDRWKDIFLTFFVIMK